MQVYNYIMPKSYDILKKYNTSSITCGAYGTPYSYTVLNVMFYTIFEMYHI